MTTPATRAAAVIAILLGGSLACSAQGYRSYPMSDYSSGPVKLVAGRLPPNYLGNNPEMIYALVAIGSKNLTKSEFETSGIAARRISAELSRLPLGELNGNDVLAVSAQVDRPSVLLEDSTAVYDAERGRFKLRVQPGSIRYSSCVGGPLHTWTLTIKAKPESSYDGVNTLGIAKTINKREFEMCGLAFKSGRDLGVDESFLGPSIDLVLPMKVDLASTAKPNLRYLLFIKLVEPYSCLVVERDEPSIEEPVDITRNRSLLVCQLLGLWVYDAKSGEVYHRFGKIVTSAGKRKQKHKRPRQ